MLFGDGALAVDAVDHGEAQIEQLVHAGARATRTGPQPQHRPLRRHDARGEFVEFGVGGRARRRQRQHEIVEIAGRSIGVRCRSIGTSTLTGPVGAVSASTAARVSTPIACCAERMR